MRDHQAVVGRGSFASREVFNPMLSCSLEHPDIEAGFLEAAAFMCGGGDMFRAGALWCKLCQRFLA